MWLPSSGGGEGPKRLSCLHVVRQVQINSCLQWWPFLSFFFIPSLSLSSSLVSLFIFLDENQSVSEWVSAGLGLASLGLPLGRASKDSAMVLWTRWASTQQLRGESQHRTRTDPLEGHARGHTLVDNNIGPSQFRYLTGRSSPERSNGGCCVLVLRWSVETNLRGSGLPVQDAMLMHHGEGRTCPCYGAAACICIGKGPMAHAAADQQLPILNLCLVVLPLY